MSRQQLVNLKLVVLVAFTFCIYHSDVNVVKAVVLDSDYQPISIASHERIVTVGVQCSLKGTGSSNLSLYGKGVPIIMRIWRSIMNTRAGGIGGLNIYVKTIITDIESSSANVYNISVAQAEAGAQIFIAAEGLLSIPLAQYAEQIQRPVLTGMSGSMDLFMCRSIPNAPCKKADNSRRFQYLFGVMTPGTSYFLPLFPLAAQYKYRTIASIWGKTDPTLKDVCMGGFNTANDLNMQFVYNYTLSTVATSGDAFKQELSSIVTILTRLKPDVVLFCYRDACLQWLQLLEQYDYFPPIHGMFECGNYNSTFLRMVQHVITPVQWDPRLRSSSYTDDIDQLFPVLPLLSTTTTTTTTITELQAQPSAQQFYQLFNQVNASLFSSLSASEAAVVSAIDSSIIRCNCTDAIGLYQSLRSLYDTSFFGLLTTDKYGMNRLRDIVLLQVDRFNQTQIIAPLTTSNYQPVIPAPTWQERVYKQQLYESFAEKVVIGLCITICVLIICIIIIWIIFRNLPDVKRSSAWLSIISLLGSILVCISPLQWLPDNSYAQCTTRLPLFGFGFAIMMCAIITKTWRISAIFNNKQLRETSFSVFQMCLVFGSAAFIPVLMTILSISIDPLLPMLHIQDENRPALNFYECNGTYGMALPLLGSGILFSLTVACYFAYRVRNAYEQFNDARCIMYGVYPLLLLLILIVSIQIGMNSPSNRQIMFSIRSMGILLAVVTLQTLLLFRHVHNFIKMKCSNGNTKGHNRIQQLQIQQQQQTKQTVYISTVGFDDCPQQQPQQQQISTIPTTKVVPKY